MMLKYIVPQDIHLLLSYCHESQKSNGYYFCILFICFYTYLAATCVGEKDTCIQDKAKCWKEQ